MKRVSWMSSEVWGNGGWIFVMGWILFSFSVPPNWSIHVLFIFTFGLGVVLVGLSTYHANRRYHALKRREGG